MKFDARYEGHLSEYLSKVMGSALNWSERIALGTVVIAMGQDRGEGQTKGDLTAVLTHGLAGLLDKGILSKGEDGTITLVQKKAEAEPGKVDTEETQADDAAPGDEAEPQAKAPAVDVEGAR